MSKRIKYNRPINYPNTFTLRELYKENHHKVKYITLYARVQKKVENGEIAIAGIKEPDTKRRGRKEVVYTLTTTAEPVTTAEVAVPATTNW